MFKNITFWNLVFYVFIAIVLFGATAFINALNGLGPIFTPVTMVINILLLGVFWLFGYELIRKITSRNKSSESAGPTSFLLNIIFVGVTYFLILYYAATHFPKPYFF
jgi:hypothetical protein